MNMPADILVVLGPRSCGKTATMMSYFADKQDVVYIDCRTFDASTPKTFAYALIKQLLPKIPRDTAQMVLKLLPEVAWKLATSMTIIGKMGTTTSEDVSLNLAGLNKQSNGSQTEQSMNDVFEALR